MKRVRVSLNSSGSSFLLNMSAAISVLGLIVFAVYVVLGVIYEDFILALGGIHYLLGGIFLGALGKCIAFMADKAAFEKAVILESAKEKDIIFVDDNGKEIEK